MEGNLRVLVTGGTGLVGCGLKRALADTPWKDAEFYYAGRGDVDLTSYESTKAYFAWLVPTHVVHLAAKVGGLFANMSDQLGFFQQNMKINDNVLRLCHEYKIVRAIFFLSTCIFPAEWKGELVEEQLHSGPPHYSNEGYALAKRMLEAQVRFYREKYGHSWLCLIPTNIYGPDDNFSLIDSHVAPALMHKGFISRKNDTALKVLGTGNALRQFVFSVDVGKIILEFLRMPDEKLRDTTWSFIVGGDPNTEVSIRDVAEIVARELKIEKGLEFDSSSSDGVYRKTVCNKKLRGLLPDFRFTTLDDGMRQTVAWMEENFDTMRK